MLDWSLVLRLAAGAFAILGLIAALVSYRRFVRDMRELERTLDDPHYMPEYWHKTKAGPASPARSHTVN